MSRPPIAWTVAGSDPSAGAGIQADLKTFAGLGVYGCSVITGVTAQNSLGIQCVELLEAQLVESQCQSLIADFPPDAVKLGMLGSAAIVETISDICRNLSAPIVCDPVLMSTSQTQLLEMNAIDLLKKRLFPLLKMLTPNLPETEKLTGMTIDTTTQIERAAARLLEYGCASVYIKGGHGMGPIVQDYWSNGKQHAWFRLPRIQTRHTHGTGCTFSSAIAAAWALGVEDQAACSLARAYVQQALLQAPGLGQGKGPLYHGPHPDQALYPHISRS
jgi:hydroxymethylpyrimidine kinase/phosphomethylpyrimidine kinase